MEAPALMIVPRTRIFLRYFLIFHRPSEYHALTQRAYFSSKKILEGRLTLHILVAAVREQLLAALVDLIFGDKYIYPSLC